MTDAEELDDFTLGLQVILEARGIKPAPLSELAGLGQTAVRDLFRKGSSPKVSTAVRLATALGTTVDEVIAAGASGKVPGSAIPKPDDPQALVPVYDVAASAGYGALVDTETIAYSMAFPPGYLHHVTSSNPRHLAIISVKGDSMSPTLKHDDIVMLDSSKTSLDYDGLFVLRYGEALHVKRVGRSGRRGHIMVMSDNRAEYPVVEYALEDVQAIGKVVWFGKKV